MGSVGRLEGPGRLATRRPICADGGPNSAAQCETTLSVPTANIVASIDMSSAESRQLAPFDSVYVNRLQEAFEMAGTNVCDVQAIPDAILNGT
jgi:hypothetical protein